jgi:hypothetical protein
MQHTQKVVLSVRALLLLKCLPSLCCLQVGQSYGVPLGLQAANAAASTALRAVPMSEQETAAWMLDLAGPRSLADLAARGLPASIDRCAMVLEVPSVHQRSCRSIGGSSAVHWLLMLHPDCLFQIAVMHPGCSTFGFAFLPRLRACFVHVNEGSVCVCQRPACMLVVCL